MKKIVLIIFILSYSTILSGQSEFWSVGISGAYNGDRIIGEREVYTQLTGVMWSRPAEFKMGVSNHSYNPVITSYDYEFKTNAVGVFTEFTIYPFHKLFYVGLRWEPFNFNWFTKETKAEIVQGQITRVDRMKPVGSRIYIAAGIAFPVSPRWNLKVFFYPGLNQYSVYGTPKNSKSTYISDRFDFTFNAGIALEFRIN